MLKKIFFTCPYEKILKLPNLNFFGKGISEQGKEQGCNSKSINTKTLTATPVLTS
jgi:hypothetical protein